MSREGQRDRETVHSATDLVEISFKHNPWLRHYVEREKERQRDKEKTERQTKDFCAADLVDISSSTHSLDTIL